MRNIITQSFLPKDGAEVCKIKKIGQRKVSQRHLLMAIFNPEYELIEQSYRGSKSIVFIWDQRVFDFFINIDIIYGQ